MSHLYYQTRKTRLHRSELAVPGSSPQMFEKALNSNADYIFLDLEDAVSPNDKISARDNIITALHDLNWKEKGKTISVRINSLDTHYMYSDVVEIVEKVGDKIRKQLSSLIYLNKKLIPKHILNQRKEFRKSIMIRNTYAEILNLLQADIMRKLNKSNVKNKKREKLLDAMFVTIAGIAAAMKNTG